MQKVGMICRCDKTGVGQGQTLRLARLLNPSKIMLIDSAKFNGNEQHYEWYEKNHTMTIDGFPTAEQIIDFLRDIDVVITAETFYSNLFTSLARKYNVKTILIANWEFMDWNKPGYIYPLPDKTIAPSYWHIAEMQNKFRAQYLPTPIFEDEFKEARKANFKRRGLTNYLFINGKTAVNDRNGLESLHAALEKSKGNYRITIKAQNDIPKHPDPRVTYDFTNPENQAELYKGFDALVLPRRYGGQALSMTEALQSAMPVIMPDIDPNNKVLPHEWLVPAYRKGEFMARTMIDIYNVEPAYLAHKLDTFKVTKKVRLQAHELGKQYDAELLRPQYERLVS